MNRNRTIIIAVVVLAAIVGGLFATGRLGGGSESTTKVTPEAIKFTDPFTVNLADTAETHYIKIGVAVELEPMSAEDHTLFTTPPGGGGHGGGGDVKTGPMRVADDPELRDAVLDVVGRYTSTEMLAPEGKETLKKALLKRFDEVASRHPVPRAKDAHRDMAAPPYHVADVFFYDFAVQ